MKAWSYYALHTFINTIKKIFRTKLLVFILVCGLFGGLIGVGFGVFFETFDNQNSNTEAQGSEYSTEELIGNTDEDGLEDTTPEESEDESDFEIDTETLMLFAEAIGFLVFIAIILFSIYFGAKKGCDIFLMPDVNFLFPSPMKGQSVLLFRLSFQLVASLFGCIYLFAQVGNLMALGFTLGQVFLTIFAILITILTAKILNVLSYIVCANHPFLKRNLQNIIIGIALIIAAGNFLAFRANNQDLVLTVQSVYGNHFLRLIPFFGWFKGFFGSLLTNNLLGIVIYGALYLAFVVATVYFTWNLKADFYEEALSGAAKRDEALQAQQEKNTANMQRAKDRSDKIKRNMGMKGQGASMFFHKEMYNRKRMAQFGFLTKTMITYLLTSVGLSLFMRLILDASSFEVVAGIIFATLFFRSLGNPIAQECANVWLVLAPAETVSKVFFSMLAGTVSCALDLLPAMLFAAIVLKANPAIVILWYITLVLTDFALCAIDLMFEAAIPLEGLDSIKASLKIMLRMLFGFGVLFEIGIVYLFLGGLIALIIACAVWVVLSALAFIIYPLKLDRGY